MKTLREIIDETSMEQRGLMMIEIHSAFGGVIHGTPMTITAVLENTAVVHPIGKAHDKVLVNLKDILVDVASVRWVNKAQEDRRLWRGRRNINVTDFNTGGDNISQN